MSEEYHHKKWRENQMLTPIVEKITVNISVGKSGESLENAAKILEQLTSATPCKRKAKKTIRDFGIRKGEHISCIVTLRKEKARNFLKRALKAIDSKLSMNCFDSHGNFSFGIKEHIEIPGIKYDPELGIHGMDVSVTLGRLGYRIKRRRRGKTKVGQRHLLSKDEAKFFIEDEFEVEVPR